MVNYVCNICGRSTGQKKRNMFNFKQKSASIIYRRDTYYVAEAPDICMECLNKIEGFINSLALAANEKTGTESEELK